MSEETVDQRPKRDCSEEKKILKCLIGVLLRIPVMW